MIMTILGSVLASSGFWAVVQRYSDRKSCSGELLLGLAHDRIMYLGMSYIKRGYITKDESENFYDYLYKPYEKMGGNGSAKRIKMEVDKLPLQEKIQTEGE